MTEFGTKPSTWDGKHWHGNAATAFTARLQAQDQGRQL